MKLKSIGITENIWKKLLKLKKALGCHNLSEVLQILLNKYEEGKNG